MAVVDAFQHWVYENPAAGADPAQCDATWTNLWQRFMPVVDWSGLEDIRATGWQRKLHIFTVPFYYVEYGLAELGAVQVWRNALQDQSKAVADYRKALALGGSVPLPQLYQAAGARLGFDAGLLGEAVALMESKIAEFEAIK
jgi:oligoendopeptidase F